MPGFGYARIDWWAFRCTWDPITQLVEGDASGLNHKANCALILIGIEFIPVNW